MINDDEDEPDLVFKWSCNQIRGKLRKYIEHGGAKTTHLQKELGVNNNSWGRFMRYTGTMQGSDNGVYAAATRFFLDMEARGEKMPTAKSALAKETEKENEAPAGAKKGKKAAAAVDLSAIMLPKQEKDEVEVFDR
jgi:hypothetical protein